MLWHSDRTGERYQGPQYTMRERVVGVLFVAALWVAAIVMLLLAACSSPSGILLTVDADGTVPAITALRITVTSGEQKSSPVVVPIEPGNIPPARTLFLSLPPDRGGELRVDVEAMGAAGVIASGSAQVRLEAGARAVAWAVLAGTAALDGGVAGDLAEGDAVRSITDDFAEGDAVRITDDLALLPDLLRCPTGMLLGPSGTYCIDATSSRLADGTTAREPMTWSAANDVCTARGARLCGEAERENLCPQVASTSAFCDGPSGAGSWEWSATTACPTGTQRNSPCCNAQPGFQACSDVTRLSGFRCCLNAL